jgi:hypothetical protein
VNSEVKLCRSRLRAIRSVCRRLKLRGIVLLGLVIQVSKEVLYHIESFVLATAETRQHTYSESVYSLKLQFSKQNIGQTLTRFVLH